MTSEQMKQLQKELHKATQDFIRLVKKQKWNTELRTRAETIVILAKQFAGQPHEAPMVTHMNIDPNASQETREVVAEVVKAAYGYKAPKVLTDEPVAWMSDDGEPISAKRHEDMEHAEHPLLVHYSTPLYLASAAGLTVEEVMRVVAKWDIEASDEAGVEPATPYGLGDLRSRLAAAMEAKTRKP